MKLLPALQQIYYGMASIRTGKPYLDAIYRDSTGVGGAEPGAPAQADPVSHLPLTRVLDLRNATYSYPNHDRTALKDLTLSIPARTTVGIVGGSGAGKTTLVDLMLGLLIPQSGEIVVDGTRIDQGNLRSWQRSIGYVPQNIFLADSSVAENIAFGMSPEEVDMIAIERAARLAALHDFVTTELPDGYQTQVGERGVRLSGGQRQRIGIARALYHDPDLLVLDEATSALDNLTERAVMEAIRNIGNEKTIVLIAHRLSTVIDCERIFLLEKGKVVSEGKYDELMRDSKTFRGMVSGEP
jgi:ABC-type multidrug transport system fused ATPase/permease subunit